MTAEMATTVEQVLRKIGGLANAALATAFVWGAVSLADAARERFAAAGGMPSLEVAALTELAASWEVVGDLGLAWIYAVAAAGCGFMALLGLRWSFHAALRAVSALRS